MDYKKAIEVLGLRQGFSAEELKKSYRILAKKYFPDNSVTGDGQMFMMIKEAYDFLSDPGNIPPKESEPVNTTGDRVCPMCNGNGWRREKIKTARGYVAQRVKCTSCNGVGRK